MPRNILKVPSAAPGPIDFRIMDNSLTRVFGAHASTRPVLALATHVYGSSLSLVYH